MSISTKKIIYSYLADENTYINDVESDLKKIEDTLKSKQFVHLYGKSGGGKSFLASKYVFNKFQEDQLVVCWLNASDRSLIHNRLKKLLNELKVNSSWSIIQNEANQNESQGLNSLNEIDDIFNETIEKINKHFGYLRFLFILDDLDLKYENILTSIYMKFKNNVKFIVTSIDKLNNFECDSFQIELNLNEVTAPPVFQNQAISSSKSRLAICFPDSCCNFEDEEDRPVPANNLLGGVQVLPDVEFKDGAIKIKLKDEMFKMMRDLKRKFVSFELIKKESISKSKDPEKVLNQLLKEKFLTETHDGYKLPSFIEANVFEIENKGDNKEILNIFESILSKWHSEINNE